MKDLDLNSLGKWIAITALILVSGFLEYHHQQHTASGFETAALLMVLFG